MTKRIDCDGGPKAELRKCGCEFCTTQLAEYKAVELNPREIREKLQILRLYESEGVIRQIRRCLLRQIKTGLTEHLTMV